MAKKADEELLTGKHLIDTDFRPDVPADSLSLVSSIGITSVELICNYKIKDDEDYREVFKIAQTAAIRKKAIMDGYANEKGPLVQAHLAHVTLTTRRGKDVAPWDLIIDSSKKHMDAWESEKERKAKIEADRIERERQEGIAKAAAEAKRIQDQADAAAREARRAGDLRESRRLQEEANARAAVLVEEASTVIETILPAVNHSISGLGHARPWVGVFKDLMQTIRAVAGIPDHKCSQCGHVDAGKKGIPLTWNISRENEPKEEVYLLEGNLKVATYLAKRLGKEDIGIPGAVGLRSRNFRISTKDDAPEKASYQSGDGW